MRPLGNINSPGDIEYTDISQLPELSDPDGRGASKQPPQYTYQLSNQAIKAILAEDNWHHHVWDPMSNKPDINKWNKDMETLCEKYGIPDTQRAQCAVASTKRELRTELQCVLQHARAESGPVCWDQFKKFMVEFTENFDPHQESTTSTLFISSFMMMTQVDSAGLGSILEMKESLNYRRTIMKLYSLLQSNTGEPVGKNVLLFTSGDDDDKYPVFGGCPLEIPTVQAIIKFSGIPPYDLSGTKDVADWLNRMRSVCIMNEIPIKQWVQCAVCNMEIEFQQAASAAGWDKMMWDRFGTWLQKYHAEKKAMGSDGSNVARLCQDTDPIATPST